MFGGLLFSLCTLNFLDVIFKESNVPLQIVNQVLIPLYDFLLACYRVILDDTTIVKSGMINCQHRQAHQKGENGKDRQCSSNKWSVEILLNSTDQNLRFVYHHMYAKR